MLKHTHRSLLAGFFVLTTFLVSPSSVLNRATRFDAPRRAEADGGGDKEAAKGDGAGARAALEQGKELLGRNRLDLALGPLETALNLYTQAGDQNGAANAHDALGDIYARGGQYDIALGHYRSAVEGFRAKNETANINLTLAKIGETYLLLGDTSQARAAFIQISEKAAPTAPGSSTSGDRSRTSFGPVLAGFAGLSCSAPNNNIASNNPNDPPFMGHGPLGPNHIGRMDLRVVDEAGNPVRGARVKLVSERSPGLPKNFVCDCAGTTDATGRYLAPPLHVGGTLNLSVTANGFQPLETQLPEESLAQPVRVTMQAKNAARAANSASNLAKPVGSCFDLYRLFVAYANSKNGQGRADYESGQVDAAKADYQDLLAAASLPETFNFKEARRFRAAARTSLGDIAFRERRYADALQLYSEAADGARQDGRLDLTWAAQRGQGRSRWALAAQEKDQEKTAKLREASLAAYRDALKTIETILEGSLRADDARTTFLAQTKDVFDEASSALAEMALGSAPSNASTLTGPALVYAAEAFKVVEQGRARSLLDILGEARVEISEGVPPDLLKRKADNLARQQEIARQLTGAMLAGSAPKESIQALEAEVDRLSTEYDSLENQIRAASPRYASLTRTQPLALNEVQQQVLDDQTILLEYNLGSENSYLWAVTRDGVALYRLPARSVLERGVVDLRSQLVPAALRHSIVGIDVASDQAQQGSHESVVPRTPAAYAAQAFALYKQVIEPAVSAVQGKRLLIVPDGALNYVPFGALVTNAGGTDYGLLPYLVRTNEVAYAPSASVIAALRQQNSKSSRQSVLILADPVFSQTDPRAKGASAEAQSAGASTRGLALSSALDDVSDKSGKSRLRIARLNNTRTEAEQIAQLTRSSGSQADVWLDLDASEANIRRREIKQYRVLHIATHGLLDAERPQFTGLILSLVGDRDDDGFLRVEEVFNLRLGNPLVMLSACETGLGKEKRGEGVMGLTRAFMYAGAPTVGVSLWSVSDASTAELMPDFYKRLLGGQSTSPTAALRGAQQALIASKSYSAPFYWAPFVLVGDWR
jgi:CHAT domain-containing protein